MLKNSLYADEIQVDQQTMCTRYRFKVTTPDNKIYRIKSYTYQAIDFKYKASTGFQFDKEMKILHWEANTPDCISRVYFVFSLKYRLNVLIRVNYLLKILQSKLIIK